MMEYRIAAADDMELLLRSRTDTLRDVNRLDADYRFSEAFLEESRKYFLEGDQTTVLALDGDRAVGCASLCYITLMPTFSHPTGKRAHLMNVWTDAAYRRQGIASRMLEMLIFIDDFCSKNNITYALPEARFQRLRGMHGPRKITALRGRPPRGKDPAGGFLSGKRAGKGRRA